MTDLDNMYFCEYSTKQRCFHIVKVKEALRINANGVVHNYGLDFIPFAMTNDFMRANAICDEMLQMMKKARRAYKVNTIKKPSFCIHPEKTNCRGCEYSVLPEAFDPGCKLSRRDGDDDEQTDD